MTTQLPGNVMRPPVTTTLVAAAPEELMGSMEDYIQKGGTVASGTGVLRVGELMKFNSGTGMWEKALSTTAEAMNRTAVDATNDAASINVILKGCVNSKVSGIVAGLSGAPLTTRLGEITVALKGRYVPAFNFIIF